MRWVGLMSFDLRKKAAREDHLERRMIRVDILPEQAGIAAALRRAFEERPVTARIDDGDPFEALLKQIH